MKNIRNIEYNYFFIIFTILLSHLPAVSSDGRNALEPVGHSRSSTANRKIEIAENSEIEFLKALPNFQTLALKLFTAIQAMKQEDQNGYLVAIKENQTFKESVLTFTTPTSYQEAIRSGFKKPNSEIAFVDNSELGLVFYKGNFYFGSWFQQNILRKRWQIFGEEKPTFVDFQRTIPWFQWNSKNNTYEFKKTGGRNQLLNDVLESGEEITLYRGMGENEFSMFTSGFSKLNPSEQQVNINKILGGQMMGLFFTNSAEVASGFGSESGSGHVVSVKLSRTELLDYAEKNLLYMGIEGDPPYIEFNISSEEFIRSLVPENRYKDIKK